MGKFAAGWEWGSFNGNWCEVYYLCILCMIVPAGTTMIWTREDPKVHFKWIKLHNLGNSGVLSSHQVLTCGNVTCQPSWLPVWCINVPMIYRYAWRHHSWYRIVHCQLHMIAREVWTRSTMTELLNEGSVHEVFWWTNCDLRTSVTGNILSLGMRMKWKITNACSSIEYYRANMYRANVGNGAWLG